MAGRRLVRFSSSSSRKDMEVRMMTSLLTTLFFFFFLQVSGDSSRTTMMPSEAEMYWTSRLPNVAMPAAIRDIVKLGKESHVGLEGVQDLPDLNDEEDPTLFFMEQELLPGKTMKFQFINRTNQAIFLPRKLAQSSPFSIQNLPQAYHHFSIISASPEGSILRRSLQKCHDIGRKGWKNETCVNSLESMIDLIVTVLGNNVEGFSSEVKQEDAQIRQIYTSRGIEKIKDRKFLACHKLNYPLGLFYCHTFASDDAYGVRVQLKGSNGAEVVGIGVCHMKRNEWEAYIARTPNRMAAVRDGRASLCHILAGDTILWTAKEKDTM